MILSEGPAESVPTMPHPSRVEEAGIDPVGLLQLWRLTFCATPLCRYWS